MTNALKAFLMNAATGGFDPVGDYLGYKRQQEDRAFRKDQFSETKNNHQIRAMIEAAKLQNELQRLGLAERNTAVKEGQFADVPKKREFDTLQREIGKRGIDDAAAAELMQVYGRSSIGAEGPQLGGFEASQRALPGLSEQSNARRIRQTGLEQGARSGTASAIRHREWEARNTLTRGQKTADAYVKGIDKADAEKAKQAAPPRRGSLLSMHATNLRSGNKAAIDFSRSLLQQQGVTPEEIQQAEGAPQTGQNFDPGEWLKRFTGQ